MGHPDRGRRARTLLAAAGLLPLTRAVLERMESDHDEVQRLRPGTVAAMYGVYAAHLTTWAAAVRRRSLPLPLPRTPAAVVGAAAAAGGAGTCLAGMRRFDSPGQLSGTERGALHHQGVYRWSRNPQYAGTVLVLAGAAVARRSGLAATLAVGAAATYRRWVRSEEAVLRRAFGAEYDTYAAQVPRWGGLPRTP